MNRLFIICLLTGLVYSQVGHYYVVQLIQLAHKHMMEEKVLENASETDLELIVYSGNESRIHWEEDGREFFYNDHLYDVVRKEYKNGKTLLYCINDTKEKQLIEEYTKATDNAGNKKYKSTYNNTVLYCEPLNTPDFISRFLITIIYPAGITQLPAVTISYIAPPPRDRSFSLS